MATAEADSRPHDRHTRKRPFAGFMKRLANLKPSTSDSPNPSGKKTQGAAQPKSKKTAVKNNPYPESGHFSTNPNRKGRLSFSSPVTPRSRESFSSVEQGSSHGQQRALAKSNKSTAPTVATNPETIHSGRSKADTGVSTTIGGGSTFSSPNHSERSLTTTLTTIRSTAPSNVLGGGHAQGAQAANAPPVHFSHQFPTSPPPLAIPQHLAPQQQQTYHTATANGILTDNASILTLASSSKRRRRNSLDTNASVRALAPSSVWGGSRESLPLSVLSANADAIYSPQNRPGAVGGGFANAERASVYSSSGVAAPALSSERNSYYANKQNADGVSVRSGFLGHGRTDSINGSIGPIPTSPLASPREPPGPGRVSRRSSDWKETGEGSDVGDDAEAPASPVSVDPGEKGKAKVVT